MICTGSHKAWKRWEDPRWDEGDEEEAENHQVEGSKCKGTGTVLFNLLIVYKV